MCRPRRTASSRVGRGRMAIGGAWHKLNKCNIRPGVLHLAAGRVPESTITFKSLEKYRMSDSQVFPRMAEIGMGGMGLPLTHREMR